MAGRHGLHLDAVDEGRWKFLAGIIEARQVTSNTNTNTNNERSKLEPGTEPEHEPSTENLEV